MHFKFNDKKRLKVKGLGMTNVKTVNKKARVAVLMSDQKKTKVVTRDLSSRYTFSGEKSLASLKFNWRHGRCLHSLSPVSDSVCPESTTAVTPKLTPSHRGDLFSELSPILRWRLVGETSPVSGLIFCIFL